MFLKINMLFIWYCMTLVFWTPGIKCATILDVAEKLGATTFLHYVNKTGLTANLTHGGPYTVFIPSNEAFDTIPEIESGDMDDNDYVRSILLYHIVSHRVPRKDMRNDVMLTSESVSESDDNKMKVRINFYQNNTVITASGSPITSFDHDANNGIVHILSRVMITPPSFGTVAQMTFLPITRYMMYGLLDSGLMKEVTEKGPFTLFVPTDLAFEQLPNKTQHIMYQNVTAIKRVMENHIVRGSYFTKGMYEGQTFRTQYGEDIRVHFIPGNVTVEDAILLLPDLTATNGVVHLTSKVFLPPGFDEMWEA